MLYARVAFPESGEEYDQKKLRNIDWGKFYPVKLISMGSSRTFIELSGVEGYWNSVNFAFYESNTYSYEDMVKVNIYNSPIYNPYKGGKGTAYTEVR